MLKFKTNNENDNDSSDFKEISTKELSYHFAHWLFNHHYIWPSYLIEERVNSSACTISPLK